MTGKGPSRRTASDVRSLISTAARELFEANGFDGTTTREIADRAGVIHAAVFRHFGSKEELFERVELDPLLEFVEAFVERWSNEELFSVAEMATHTYVSALFDLVRRNRTLFAMLMSTGASAPPTAAEARRALDRHLRDLEQKIATTSGQDTTTMDMALALRFNLALVLGLVLFGEVLFPAGGPQLSEEALVDEVSDYVQRGAIIPPD